MLIALSKLDKTTVMVNTAEIAEVCPTKIPDNLRDSVEPRYRVILRNGSEHVCSGTIEDFAKSLHGQLAVTLAAALHLIASPSR